MRKRFTVALALCAGLCLWSTGPALAANFYILATSEDQIYLVDPTTIAAAQSGHKIFHLIDVSEFELWGDNRMEVDCIAARWRKLSSVSYQQANALPGLASPGPWDTLKKGSVSLSMHGVVCRWTNNGKPQKGSYVAIWTAPNLMTAVSQVSRRISYLKHEKK